MEQRAIHFIKYTRFRLWRWWFTRYKLPKIIRKSYRDLMSEYRQYCQMVWDKELCAMSFEDWCGDRYK